MADTPSALRAMTTPLGKRKLDADEHESSQNRKNPRLLGPDISTLPRYQRSAFASRPGEIGLKRKGPGPLASSSTSRARTLSTPARLAAVEQWSDEDGVLCRHDLLSFLC